MRFRLKRFLGFLGCLLLGLTIVTIEICHCADDKGEISDGQQEALAKIKALPYLSGYKPAPKKVGVTRYDVRSAYKGLNFYVSGHAPRAYLMDMKGKVLHEWGIEYKDVWPESGKADRWRRAHLFDNGDLLAIFTGGARGMVKLDKDSRLLWAYKSKHRPGSCHHDLFVAEDGGIYVLTNRRVVELDYKGRKFAAPFMEGFITILTPRGKEIRNIPLIDCFQNSDYASVLKKMRRAGDLFHTNTIEVFNGRITDKAPMCKKGHALISSPYLSTIAIVDLDEEKVTWAMGGKWKEQHEPILLENGNMLLFDNLGGEDGKSRVMEFSPVTKQVVWVYGDDPPDSLFSKTCGSNQRLPNGNTLITESESGRAFEVTPEKKIVWEFFNPHRTGADNELIAAIPELIRIVPGPDFFLEDPAGD